MAAHEHTKNCLPGCTRVEDVDLPGRTITEIMDLRAFHAEIHRRNRKPRRGEWLWWQKMGLRIFEKAAIFFLGLLGLAIARWLHLDELLTLLLKAAPQ